MDIKNNKGMYLEELVTRTISYYFINKIGFIEKRQIPMTIIKNINEKLVIAKLMSKSKVDYFGVIQNIYFEFECKQTSKEYFDIVMIKKHQIEYFNKCVENNIACFVLICFELHDSIIMIEFKKLMSVFESCDKNKIPYQTIVNNGIITNIIYPGILDLYTNLKQLVSLQ